MEGNQNHTLPSNHNSKLVQAFSRQGFARCNARSTTLKS